MAEAGRRRRYAIFADRGFTIEIGVKPRFQIIGAGLPLLDALANALSAPIEIDELRRGERRTAPAFLGPYRIGPVMAANPIINDRRVIATVDAGRIDASTSAEGVMKRRLMQFGKTRPAGPAASFRLLGDPEAFSQRDVDPFDEVAVKLLGRVQEMR